MGELVSREEFEMLVARVQLLERAQSRIVGEPFDGDDAIARAIAAQPAPVVDVVEGCAWAGHEDEASPKFCGLPGCTFPVR